MEYIILFIFGSAIGSFLNVLIYRLEESEKIEADRRGKPNYRGSTSIVGGRSYCPQCKHQIRWYDNIPILSFLILSGRCRDCGGKISFQYPLVEAATGLLFIVIYFLSAPSVIPVLSSVIPAEAGIQTLINLDSRLHGNDIWVALGYLFIIFSGLFAIFVYDLKHYIIPNKIIYPLILAVVVFNLSSLFTLHSSIFTFVLSFTIPLFFLSLIMVSRGKWMGMGDVKLALFMAIFLGWPNVLVAAILSFWIGTLASLPLIFIGKKGLKSQIPFGPFLIIGTFLAYFWGEKIVNWYLSISY